MDLPECIIFMDRAVFKLYILFHIFEQGFLVLVQGCLDVSHLTFDHNYSDTSFNIYLLLFILLLSKIIFIIIRIHLFSAL